MRIQSAGSAVLQLDDFDARDVLAGAAPVSASRIELRLPREEEAVAQPICSASNSAASSGCRSAAML